jgi:hypothetical protein
MPVAENPMWVICGISLVAYDFVFHLLKCHYTDMLLLYTEPTERSPKDQPLNISVSYYTSPCNILLHF